MAFNPDTHFKVRNMTRDHITLKAADGSYAIIPPGSGDRHVEHKFNWDLPPRNKLVLHGIPHPEQSVMTADLPKPTTHVGRSHGIGLEMAPPAMTVQERVQATLDRINYNRVNKVPPKISNKQGKMVVGKQNSSANNKAAQMKAAQRRNNQPGAKPQQLPTQKPMATAPAPAPVSTPVSAPRQHWQNPAPDQTKTSN